MTARQALAGSLILASILVATAGLAGERSLSGSTLTCRESAYRPGAVQSLEFLLYNASVDEEWIRSLVLSFPAGVSVTGSTSFVGGDLLGVYEMASDDATGDGAVVSWYGQTAPDAWGVVWNGCTAHGVVTVAVDAGFGGDLDVGWEIVGDQYGAEPHVLSGTVTLAPAPNLPEPLHPDDYERLGTGRPAAYMQKRTTFEFPNICRASQLQYWTVKPAAGA